MTTSPDLPCISFLLCWKLLVCSSGKGGWRMRQECEHRSHAPELVCNDCFIQRLHTWPNTRALLRAPSGTLTQQVALPELHKLTVNGFTHRNTLLETGQRSWLGSVLTEAFIATWKKGICPNPPESLRQRGFTWSFIDWLIHPQLVHSCSVVFLCKALCCFIHQIEQITSYIVISDGIDPARRAKLAMHMMACYGTAVKHIYSRISEWIMENGLFISCKTAIICAVLRRLGILLLLWLSAALPQ